jgi:hypothetical protein
MDRAELLKLINSAWEKHAQHIAYQMPGGCGGHVALKMPAPLMAELGFKVAVGEIFDALMIDCFSAGDMADQGAKAFREGAQA